MWTAHERTVRCTVYQGEGHAAEHVVTLGEESDPTPMHSKLAHLTPLRSIMARALVCARPDLRLTTVLALMVKHRVGCIPIVDGSCKPCGVVTKLDLVELLDRTARGDGVTVADLRCETASDAMTPLAVTLPDHASVAHAAAIMVTEVMHHVLVVDDHGVLVGAVSAEDIVAWVARQAPEEIYGDVTLPPPPWRTRVP